MPSDVERLEQQLLASWTRDTLAAYGKALRKAGDPRGTLIDLDLREDDEDPARETAEEQWLGDLAGVLLTKYGFVEDCYDLERVMPELDRVLRYTRAFDIYGEPDEVVEAITIAASAPRPWLKELKIRQLDDRTAPLVDAATCRRFVDATPHLRKLTLEGHHVLALFEHPTIERLVIDGHDAVPALLGHGTFARLDTLDLAIHPHTVIDHEPPPDELRALLPAASFPQLRTLDLSRNEPRESTLAPNCLGGKTAIIDVLARTGVLPQIVNLRMPSLRDAKAVAELQAVIDRMPRLRTLDVARSYTKHRVSLSHAARVTVAPRSPWPPGNEVGEYTGLIFQLEDSKIRVDLERAYEICETATLDPEQQEAWGTLWSLVATLADKPDRIEKLSRDVVVSILETIEDDEHSTWLELREQMDDLPASVPVRRIEGYESTPGTADEKPAVPRTRADSERIAEHERVLQESFDLERLAVYADELQQLGDARGELIALDLQLQREARPDLASRREEIHEQIFGAETWIESQLGFAAIKVSAWGSGDESLVKFLDGDAARYLASVDLGGPVDRVVRDVKHLASASRPWLRRLGVETMGEVRDTIAADALGAWPILEELELAADEPTRLFHDFAHPRVGALRVTGWPAFAGLGAPWPALHRIDLAYGGGMQAPDDPVGYFGDPRALPALRVLDLSRNEPSDENAILDRDFHRYQAGLTDIYEVLPSFGPALLAKLAVLRLPSLRTVEHVRTVQALLDAMPNLVGLEIARVYPDAPAMDLRHPSATIDIPPPCAWPPLDQIEDDAALVVEGVTIPLDAAIFAMERHHDALPAPAREGWSALWAGYHADRRKFTMSAAALYRAAEAVAKIEDYLIDDFVDELVEGLHRLAIADKTVTVKRGTT